jgi:hypothetical protein
MNVNFTASGRMGFEKREIKKWRNLSYGKVTE